MSSNPVVQNFSIRVPKNSTKKCHVMRFNSVLNVDFSKWTQVKMERENNQKEFKLQEEEIPKFGAGSEYGREAREEARRKKYGIITRRYKPEEQPWILKSGGKTGKKFKGIREGGVAENTAYYVFTHAADNSIEAYPLHEWYNFQPIQRYKALTAEEAEQEFGRRNKAMNYFSLMLRKRLKNDEDGEGEEVEEGKPKKGGKRKSKDFKISEMDEWVDTDEDDSDSDREGGDEDGDKKNKKKTKQTKKGPPKKKKRGSDDSAVEESDDGDEEGRELDYISDSSESETDDEAKVQKEMKGVAEEDALRKLLTSDEEEEENNEQKQEDKDVEKDDKESKENQEKDKKRKRTKQKDDKGDKKGSKAEDDSSSDTSPDSSDAETDPKSKNQPNSGGSSRSGTPTLGDKRDGPSAKKQKLDLPQTPISFGGDSGITEDAVRRYLMRKPMTTTELLQKFKGRKTGLNSERLVNVMTQILKRINPVKQTIKNKMYLSIKPS